MGKRNTRTQTSLSSHRNKKKKTDNSPTKNADKVGLDKGKETRLAQQLIEIPEESKSNSHGTPKTILLESNKKTSNVKIDQYEDKEEKKLHDIAEENDKPIFQHCSNTSLSESKTLGDKPKEIIAPQSLQENETNHICTGEVKNVAQNFASTVFEEQQHHLGKEFGIDVDTSNNDVSDSQICTVEENKLSKKNPHSSNHTKEDFGIPSGSNIVRSLIGDIDYLNRLILGAKRDVAAVKLKMKQQLWPKPQ